MLSFLRTFWRTEAPARAQSHQRRSMIAVPLSRLVPLSAIRGRYDAAVTTDGNRRHWANADGLSADAAASPEVRRVLRNRARYEVANNSYARGIVSTLANDVVGTGPRLQMLTNDPDANARIERAFGQWAKAVGLAAKLRTMRSARAEAGESFALMARNTGLPTPVQLDIRLIEADQVSTPDLALNEANAVDGIVFDEFGNPVEYHVLKQHPGDVRWSAGLKYDRVPAESMVHYFRADRPGQSRGIPDITPAIPLFAQLRRFTLAVLAAAETAAEFAGVLQTDAPPNGEAEDIEPMDTIEIEQRMLLTLPGGWKMAQMKAEQPATTYGEFKREILNEIARCLNMPYNVAAGNSSGYNYASGRLDHQTYFKANRIEQAHLECTVLDRIFDAWLDEAVLVEDLLPQSMRMTDAPRNHQWFWDGNEHVDPAKEANSQSTRLTSRTTSLAREYAKQGLDWEMELRQIAKERALLRELGIEDQTETAPVGVPSPVTEDDDEDQPTDNA